MNTIKFRIMKRVKPYFLSQLNKLFHDFFEKLLKTIKRKQATMAQGTDQ